MPPHFVFACYVSSIVIPHHVFQYICILKNGCKFLYNNTLCIHTSPSFLLRLGQVTQPATYCSEPASQRAILSPTPVCLGLLSLSLSLSLSYLSPCICIPQHLVQHLPVSLSLGLSLSLSVRAPNPSICL